jgi:hypothetical protein
VQPYAPRLIRPLGVMTLGGWRLKRYSIVFGDAPHEPQRFEVGRALAFRELPATAVAEDRPGAAILIEHQGRDVDYLVLAWWDRENELPRRVFVRDAGKFWRPNRASESVCVWDLEVLWAERNAYVRTVLGSPAQPVEAYLAVNCCEQFTA